MAGDDSLDRDTLSSMTVVELREICKGKSLLVSGRKSELVDRILGDLDTEPETDAPEAADALIMDEGPDEASETDSHEAASERTEHAEAVERLISRLGGEDRPEAVSYTHLTLPTNREV